MILRALESIRIVFTLLLIFASGVIFARARGLISNVAGRTFVDIFFANVPSPEWIAFALKLVRTGMDALIQVARAFAQFGVLATRVLKIRGLIYLVQDHGLVR